MNIDVDIIGCVLFAIHIFPFDLEIEVCGNKSILIFPVNFDSRWARVKVEILRDIVRKFKLLSDFTEFHLL